MSKLSLIFSRSRRPPHISRRWMETLPIALLILAIQDLTDHPNPDAHTRINNRSLPQFPTHIQVFILEPSGSIPVLR